MRIIATISQPTEGQVSWNEASIAEKPNTIRKVLGYLPQDFGVYPNLSAIEFLEFQKHKDVCRHQVYTCSCSYRDKRRGIEAKIMDEDVEAYLEKPYDPDNLITTIKNILK